MIEFLHSYMHPFDLDGMLGFVIETARALSYSSNTFRYLVKRGEA